MSFLSRSTSSIVVTPLFQSVTAKVERVDYSSLLSGAGATNADIKKTVEGLDTVEGYGTYKLNARSEEINSEHLGNRPI